ncbi:alpha/beta fold hydrolase [Nocardia sp. 348MFTsu5.1]|uniref:alpha/beta fold hydrolase n=1 Tax=Nocardia sp. 348MFTsu5.1 TaxID=1172185 RepID=UPI00036A8EF6|nr:alpha/beta hydrolase [Nocardia sp. 348MFTsu5.1]
MNPLKPQLSESAMERLGHIMIPFTTNTPLAKATGLGIRNEAIVRRTVSAPVQFGTKLVGYKTPATRRRLREVSAAAQLREAAAESSGDSSAAGRSNPVRPLVNWHEGGSGPALLLLNGFTASGLVWPEAWVRSLEEHYRVIRIDNRGTGWSRSAPAPFTLGDLADDARDVLRACGIIQATVLGISMGGMIAQELAIRHGDFVDELILVATRPPTPAQIAPGLDGFLVLMRQPPAGSDLHEFLIDAWGQTVGEGFADAHPEVMTEIADQAIERVTPRSGIVSQARAIAAWNGPSRLRRITAHTTVVHGNRDKLMPVGNGMRLTRLIPDANYIELPGVGHLVPQEAGDALLEFLQRGTQVSAESSQSTKGDSPASAASDVT